MGGVSRLRTQYLRDDDIHGGRPEEPMLLVDPGETWLALICIEIEADVADVFGHTEARFPDRSEQQRIMAEQAVGLLLPQVIRQVCHGGGGESLRCEAVGRS